MSARSSAPCLKLPSQDSLQSLDSIVERVQKEVQTYRNAHRHLGLVQTSSTVSMIRNRATFLYTTKKLSNSDTPKTSLRENGSVEKLAEGGTACLANALFPVSVPPNLVGDLQRCPRMSTGFEIFRV